MWTVNTNVLSYKAECNQNTFIHVQRPSSFSPVTKTPWLFLLTPCDCVGYKCLKLQVVGIVIYLSLKPILFALNKVFNIIRCCQNSSINTPPNQVIGQGKLTFLIYVDLTAQYLFRIRYKKPYTAFY